MAKTMYLDDDIVRLRDQDTKKAIATLFWGDSVRVTGTRKGQKQVELSRREWDPDARRYETVDYQALLPARARFRDAPVLKMRFVDVGQGDGAMLETPKGKIVLIDGGEEEHLRRYINVAFSHVLRTRPLHCDAIVVTHGDADHFAGLTKLVEGFRNRKQEPLITAARVYHNGLVKASSSSGQLLGRAVKEDGKTYAVQLENDLLEVPDGRMNRPFLAWKGALKRLQEHHPELLIRRLEYGTPDAFDFLESEGIDVKVLGPIVEEVRGKPALPFLHKPGSSQLSDSHTINGHSIVLKVTYGNVRFLLGADLNEESEERLLDRTRQDNLSLAAEVLKVPHHGSADFSPRVLEAIRPVVSVVSCGDESTAKEYIHPRAGLVGALGKYSRATVERPLIYVTEMVAFFERLGAARVHKSTDAGYAAAGKEYANAYSKRAFGIVHVRTDGRRVLVATHSGKDDQKESYAFTVDERGDVTFEPKPVIR